MFFRVSPGAVLSRVRLFATPWTVAHQAPLSVGFSIKDIGVGAISCSSLPSAHAQRVSLEYIPRARFPRPYGMPVFTLFR